MVSPSLRDPKQTFARIAGEDREKDETRMAIMKQTSLRRCRRPVIVLAS
jgi:hypothetical protein